MQVKTKNILVIGLAVLLTLVMWHRFIYSSMTSQASKADQSAQDGQTRVKVLQAQLRKLEGGDDPQSHKATLEELQNAIPASTALSSFLRSADSVRIASGVSFSSIVPSTPTVGTTGVGTINLGINVQGSYAQVTDYINRLNGLGRLVVIDSVNYTAGAAEGSSGGTGGAPTGDVFAGQGAAPLMSIQITARVFTQQGALGTAGTTAGAPTQPAGGTAPATPTGVQTG